MMSTSSKSSGESQKRGNAVDYRDIGALASKDVEVIFRRLEVLGALAHKAIASDADVRAQAEIAKLSSRTLWSYLSAYRTGGLVGLAPKRRTDSGTYHKIPEEVVELVRGLKLSNPTWSASKVLETAKSMAAELNLPAPSKWHVNRICRELSPVVKLIAGKDSTTLRSKYRITYPVQHSGIVFQMDHNLVDVLVLDRRSPKYRTKSGSVRPWLTLIIDAASRRVIAFILSYDRPNRHTVASAIRKALLASRGGIPQEIWVDNGKDLVSRHVTQFVKALGIDLHICDPHQPQQRAIVERFFGVLNSRLWSTLPGYVSSNTLDRSPVAKAELTIKELEAKLDSEIARYNSEVHSSLGLSPDDYWDQNCPALRVTDERVLDILLLEPAPRRVTKHGIKYDGRIYWHHELAPFVARDVLIRADTRYETPDEIEVYYGDKWLCTAYALDSEKGSAVSQTEVLDAQQRQRDSAGAELAKAKSALKTAEDQIARQKELAATEAKSTIAEGDTDSVSTPSPLIAKKQQPKRVSSSKKSRRDALIDQIYRDTFGNMEDRGEEV